MTAIMPASVHLFVGLTGAFARLTPVARTAAGALSEHWGSRLSPGEQTPVRLTLVFSRIWYPVSAAITVGVIASASWHIRYTHAPFAAFLSDLAQCAASWSGNVQCVWF